jgi:small conductance mechanosensitive channel
MKIDIFSDALLKTFLYAGITLLIAVLVDYTLRSLIKVPKHFNNKRTRTAAAVLRNIITAFVYLFASYIIITLFGIDLTPLLASASIIGIIIGIGARSIIEDFVNGLFLLSQDSIAIGDYIKTGDIEGTVEYIGARTLKLRAGNGTMRIIPNSQVQGVTNYTRYNKFNVLIELPVKANQNIDTVIQATDDALKKLQADPEFREFILPETQVNGIEDFKNLEIMTVSITISINSSRRVAVARRYRFLVKKEFEKQKIQFA